MQRNSSKNVWKIILQIAAIHLEYYIQLWGPQPLRVSPEEGHKDGGLEHLLYEDRLRDLRIFSLKKRRLWEDLRVAFQYLLAACIN